MQQPSEQPGEVTPDHLTSLLAEGEKPKVKGKPRRRRWPVIIALGFIVLLMLSGVGFVTASVLEEQDTFCISCHTVPEVHYYNRAYIALDNPNLTVNDLATAHYVAALKENKQAFTCIQCHRGDSSLGHRIATVTLGARDAAIFILGKENSVIEKTKTQEGWLPNAACATCHTEILLTLKGLDNHFHTHLPQATTALGKGGTLKVPDSLKDKESDLRAIGLKPINTTLVCSDCHQAHVTIPGGARDFYMQLDQRNEACVACHMVAKEGPQDANSLK
jgi:nitrate/TMAO reductase-like tetraheme cytochrome c subunit